MRLYLTNRICMSPFKYIFTYSLRNLFLCLIGIFVISCVDKTDELLSNTSIRFGVMPLTRTMVENDNDLKMVCHPEGGGKEIGIWSMYEIGGHKVSNVLGNPNGDVSLQYLGQTDWENYEGWTYGEYAEFWKPNAKYTFNAYFPKDVVDRTNLSNDSTFVIEYNTESYQEDLMTAYAFANTGLSGFNAATPVPLNLLHTLAAVKFQFLFKNPDGSTYQASDRLMACWLENSISGTGMAVTGILAFGKAMTDGTLNGEYIQWYNEDYPEPSTSSFLRRFYVWEDENGVAFNSTTSTALPATSHSTGSGLYASNEGWIMIIPQQIDSSVQLCFRMATTGDMIHRVNLPTTLFEAGKRHTYQVYFGQSNVKVTLKIAEWNELKSSYDIAL